MRGGDSAVLWFDKVLLADPLAAAEAALAAREWSSAHLLGAGLLALLAVTLTGRAFCGWLCPLGLILDLNDALRRRLDHLWRKLRGHHLPNYSLPERLRYFVLLFLLVFALCSSLPLFQAFSPIHAVTWACAFSIGDSGNPAAALSLLPIGLLMLVELFARRLWCRSLCPLGALYSLLGRRALWRIRIDQQSEPHTPCAACTRSCPMGIAVMEDYVLQGHSTISDSSCTKCGDCTRACPAQRLFPLSCRDEAQSG